MRVFLTFSLVVVLVIGSVFGDVPSSMNYQGLLADPGGSPVADGSYSVVFTIYDAAVAGNSKWTETQSVTTTNGLFAVLLGSVNPVLDTVFNDTTRYLGITVAGDPELSPRTSLTSVPYAQRVSTLDGSNGGQLTGTLVWSNDMALVDDPMMFLFDPAPAGPTTRQIFAHSSTLQDLGLEYNTTNDAFEFSFGGPVMTIEMLTHRVGIGTNAPQSELDVIGTIRAQGVEMGVNPTRSGFQSTIGGGGLNTVSADWALVAGGQQNIASGLYSTTSGGQNNVASGNWSSVGGGGDNTAGNTYATVGGGTNNTVSQTYSTIAGGIQNSVSGQYSSILGGFADTISSNHSYLFGINANLAQDSTFRVDMPHIQFGSSATGYEFPATDGESGQIMSTDGSGQISWTAPGGGGGSSGWVDDGTVVRLDEANDSVGIGTSTPSAPVHISRTSNSATPAFGFKTDFSNSGTGGGIAAYITYNHGNSSGISSGMLVTSTANSSDTAYGIGASANNDGSGPAKGGLFSVAGSGSGHKYGIEALAENSADSETRGVYGIASNSGAGSATGGYFQTKSGGTGAKTGVAASAEDNSIALSTGLSALAYNTGSGGSLGATVQASGGSGLNKGINLLVTSSGSSDAMGYLSYISTSAGTAYGTSFDVNSSSGGAIGLDVSATTSGFGTLQGARLNATSNLSGATGIDITSISNSTGSGYGVYSTVDHSGSGPVSAGYFVTTSNGTGIKHGVFAKAQGNQSAAVYGNLSTGLNLGAGSSYGAITNSSTASGDAYGTFADVSSTSGNVFGVASEATSYGAGTAFGGRFIVTSQGTGYKYGVEATATGTTSNTIFGVSTVATNNGSGDAYGLFGSAGGSGGGAHYGVYGTETPFGSGAAVYAAGDQIASGTKSAVVRTSKGEKLMYAVEATEVWFEHIGDDQLTNGSVHIELDPLFLETVSIDPNNPIKVFVQLNDDCNGTYVKVSQTGFDVYELQNGSSNASFTYKVMAKRKGYKTDYMRDTQVGKYDLNLYPERKAEIEAYWEDQYDQARAEESSKN